MSELGSIYGTTVDGSNTLVIDFSQVQINSNKLVFNSSDNNMKIIDKTYAGAAIYTLVKGLSIIGSGNNATIEVGVNKEGDALHSYGIVTCNRPLTIQGSQLRLYTVPTTGSIEVKTAQMYPQTNNATLLGGANNRWSTGYFQNLNTNDCTGSLNPAYDAGAGSPNLSVGNGYPLRWFYMSCYSLYYGTGGQGSDDRIKHNEVDVSNGLDIIRQLTPKKYKKSLKMYDANYNGEIEGEWNWETGLIAQEILKIPDVSFSVKGGDRMVDGELKEECHSVDYNSIFSYNIAATKELDTIVQNQQTEITELKNENTLLKNALNTLLSEAGKPTI